MIEWGVIRDLIATGGDLGMIAGAFALWVLDRRLLRLETKVEAYLNGSASDAR